MGMETENPAESEEQQHANPSGHPVQSEMPFAVVEGEPVTELPVTAFRDYLTCPFRFYLRRILKLQAADDSAAELDGAQFGSKPRVGVPPGLRLSRGRPVREGSGRG